MKSGNEWTPDEDAIVVALYPKGGWRAVNAELPHRTQGAIRCRAKFKGSLSAKPYAVKRSLRPQDENPVPVPTHEYQPDDRAWQAANLPVFNRGMLTWRFA